MKKCNVLSYNPYRHVIVFQYEEQDIQAYFETTEKPEHIYAEQTGDGLYALSLDEPSEKPKRRKNTSND